MMEWAKLKKQAELDRKLPYPKIVIELEHPNEIVFALNDDTGIILHTSYNNGEGIGETIGISIEEYVDYDGFLNNTWVEIINKKYDIKSIEHISFMTDSEAWAFKEARIEERNKAEIRRRVNSGGDYETTKRVYVTSENKFRKL